MTNGWGVALGIGAFPAPTSPPLPVPQPTICGITDAFNRTVADGLGTSDAGIPYFYNAYVLSGRTAVDGTRAVIRTNGVGPSYAGYLQLNGLSLAPSANVTYSFQYGSGIDFRAFVDLSEDDNVGNEIASFYLGSLGNTAGTEWRNNGDNIKVVRAPDGYFGSKDTGAFPLSHGVVYHVRVQADNVGARIRLWVDGSAEPSTWLIQSTTASPSAFNSSPVVFFIKNENIAGPGVAGPDLFIDNLDISGVNRCTQSSPVPPPTGGGAIAPFPGPGANTPDAFLSLVANMSYDTIEIAAGTYNWDGVTIDVDRTSRPLTIKAAAGAVVTFVGNGSTSSGIFFFGLRGYTAYIHFTGFVFDGITLAQAGVLELRSTTHCTFDYLTFKNLRRDPTVAGSAVYKSWCAYISMGSGVRNQDNLVIDNWDCQAPAVYRDVSCLNNGSSTLRNGPISITNMRLTNYDYAIYVDVPTSSIVLRDWTITDCGNHTTPASVRFTAKDISGSYSNLAATLSDPLLNESVGTMTNGGGNSGL